MLTSDGDVMVYPGDRLQVWSGDWSSTHRNTINLQFPVMVAGRPNIPIDHQVKLLRHTDIYASTSTGTQFMLAPWSALTPGPSFEDDDTAAATQLARLQPRLQPGLHHMETGGSLT